MLTAGEAPAGASVATPSFSVKPGSRLPWPSRAPVSASCTAHRADMQPHEQQLGCPAHPSVHYDLSEMLQGSG